jgi:hypothetical protein
MSRKQPTQREAKELAAINNSAGAYYLVIFNKSGRPECSRFGAVSKFGAHRLLNDWIIPSRKARKKKGL